MAHTLCKVINTLEAKLDVRFAAANIDSDWCSIDSWIESIDVSRGLKGHQNVTILAVALKGHFDALLSPRERSAVFGRKVYFSTWTLV